MQEGNVCVCVRKVRTLERFHKFPRDVLSPTTIIWRTRTLQYNNVWRFGRFPTHAQPQRSSSGSRGTTFSTLLEVWGTVWGTVPGTVRAAGTLIGKQAPCKLSLTAPPSTSSSQAAASYCFVVSDHRCALHMVKYCEEACPNSQSTLYDLMYHALLMTRSTPF